MRSTRKFSRYFSGKNALTPALNFIPAFLLLLPISAFAFTFTVVNTTDAVDDNIGDGICAAASPAACTLRAAVQEANAWPGTDTILINAGTYNLTITGAGETAAATGDLNISEDVTIKGAGSSTTFIDGNTSSHLDDATDRIFDISQASITVTISDITIQNGAVATPGGGITNSGDLTLRDSVIRDNVTTAGAGGGGGIYTLNRLTLDNVEIDNNDSQLSIGGGISTNASSSVTTINNSTLSNNTATQNGGGIAINAGTVSITDTTISTNSSPQQGGGISNAGVLTINRSIIDTNDSYFGAGIRHGGVPGTTLTITNSTISGNFSPTSFNGSPSDNGDGAGLYLASPTTLNSVTITNNRATNTGGGIYMFNGNTISILNSIIADNQTGNPTHNDPTKPVVLGNCNMFGSATSHNRNSTVTSNGSNMDNDNSCGLGAGTGDNTSPGTVGLTALSNNGGQTRTHELSSGSNALGAGLCSGITTDQRGVARPTPCDMGAYEQTATETSWSDLDVSITDSADPVQEGGNITYRVSVKNLGPQNNNSANIDINNILPAGLTYQSDDSGGEFSGVVWTINTLAKNDPEKVINITASTGPSTGTLTSTPVLAAADQNTANDSDSETTTLTTTTDLSVAITSPAGNVIADQPFDYIFQVTNSATDKANNVVFTSMLPASVTSNDSPTTTSGSCSLSASILSCNLGALNASASATITLNVTPNSTGSFTNTAYANFNGIDSAVASNKSSLISNVVAKSVDMGVTITPSTTATVPRGSDINYTFSMINNGTDTATDLVLTITLPADVSRKQDAFGTDVFISEQDNQNNNLFTCTLGLPTVTCTRSVTLANGDSTFVTLPLNINVSAATSFNVSAAISHSLSSDPVSSNDSDTVTTNTSTGGSTPQTDLFVSISADPSQNVVVGDNLTFTAAVRNLGSGQASDVVLTYHLPNNATFVAIESGCSVSNTTATCPTWTLAPNTQASAALVVRPTAVGNVVASAEAINNAGEDPDASNNSASLAVSVVATATNDPVGLNATAGSGCFIATAAYGSYLDPNVITLRNFRDDVLLRSEIGTALVHFYYSVSPPIAAYISQNESLRTATRWALTPLVYGFKYPLAALFLALILAATVMRYKKQSSHL